MAMQSASFDAKLAEVRRLRHDAELAEVRCLFHFRDEKVQVFIGTYPDSLPLLLMMHAAIKRHFKEHADYIVDLEAAGMWGDGSGDELFVLVQCDLDADAAVEILDGFEERWWSFASQLEDWPIHVEAEYCPTVNPWSPVARNG